MKNTLAALLCFILFSCFVVPASEIETLLAVDTYGQGNVQASAAWKQLVAGDSAELPRLFEAFDRSTPLSANWIRTAAEVIIRKIIDRPSGKAELEAFLTQFILNRDYAAVGRLFALEMLETYFPPKLVESLFSTLLTDPCGEMRRPAVAFEIDYAKGLSPAVEVKQLQEALRYAYDYDQVDFIVNRIAELNEKENLGLDFDQAVARGFLVDWQVVGPFDNTDGKGFHTEYGPDRLFLEGFTGPFEGKHGQVDWKPARPTDPLAILQFNALCGREKNVCAYATAEIDSETARSVSFRVSSFNAIKVWVNGKLLGVHEIYHGHEEPDQYIMPCDLPRGKSRILVKVCQNNQPQEYAWEWRVRVRVVEETADSRRQTAGKTADSRRQTAEKAADSRRQTAEKTADSRRQTAGKTADSRRQTAEILPTADSSAVCRLPSADWFSFRGPLGNPVLENVSEILTQTLDAFDERSVLWKTPLPGTGPSSPILVDDLVVVTAASGVHQKRLHVIAVDKNSGEKRWERTILATGSLLFQAFGGIAANTPVSDGKRIVAMYSSNDVVCFDLEGNLLWTRGLAYELPNLRIDTGMSSSPVIFGDRVFVQCVSQGEAFFAALDLNTGADLWRIPRKKEQIWSSPAICPLPQGNPLGLDAVLLVVAREKLSIVNPITGEIPCEYGLGEYVTNVNTITSPTGINGVAYLQGNGIHKIDLSQFPPEPVAVKPVALEPEWIEPGIRIDNPSPVIRGEKIYSIKAPGILMQNETETGETDWQIRLEGPFWMTPIIAGDHLIACNHGGLVQVVALPKTDDEKARIVGTVQWEPRFLATPAADADAVYFRTDTFLRKVGGK